MKGSVTREQNKEGTENTLKKAAAVGQEGKGTKQIPKPNKPNSLRDSSTGRT
jgi:hypothetical protein